MPLGDTIVALATPNAASAIAVVRVSGPLCKDLMKGALGRLEDGLQARRAYLCSYRSVEGVVLDKVLATYFEEGASYTGEALVEISAHGNPLIAQSIVEDCVERGCRMAEPGEFTRTAFVNGKLDLAQAEAVADVIEARSLGALECAQRALSGALGAKMAVLSDRLLGARANIEAYIDFPEDDLPEENAQALQDLISGIKREIEELLATEHYRALMNEGVEIVLVGAPNAGKSSLLNALLGTNRAIVSEQPGTTRDYIVERVMLGKHCVRLVDTAGLHEAASRVEAMGIERTLEQVEQSDLYVLVVDQSAPSPTLPNLLIERMRSDNSLVVFNKSDLKRVCEGEAFCAISSPISVCANSGEGVAALREALVGLLDARVAPLAQQGIVVNARHALALKKALDQLAGASEELARGEEVLAANALLAATDALAEVVGKIDNERMLDKLFSSFCIGK